MSNSAIFRYQYGDHEIEAKPPLNIYIDGIPIKDSKYGGERISNLFASTLKYQLNNGDVFEINRKCDFKKSPKQPLLPNEYIERGNDINSSTVYSFSMKVNGIELEPIPQITCIRDIDSMRQLSSAYEALGNLTKADFLAVKKLIGCDVRNNYSPILNLKIGDRDIPIQPDAIRVGDSINCHLNNALGIYNKTMDIQSVKNIDIGPIHMPRFSEYAKAGFNTSEFTMREIVIDGGNACLTNIPFDKEMKNLEKLMELGQLHIEELKDLIPMNATLDEFQIVQELYSRDIRITEPLLEELSKGLTVDEAIRSAYERFAEVTFDSNEIDEIDEIDGPDDITQQL